MISGTYDIRRTVPGRCLQPHYSHARGVEYAVGCHWGLASFLLDAPCRGAPVSVAGKVPAALLVVARRAVAVVEPALALDDAEPPPVPRTLAIDATADEQLGQLDPGPAQQPSRS